MEWIQYTQYLKVETYFSCKWVKLINEDISMGLYELLKVPEAAILYYHVEFPLGPQVLGAGPKQVDYVDMASQADHYLDFRHQRFDVSYVRITFHHFHWKQEE